jgi:hypothetical protein
MPSYHFYSDANIAHNPALQSIKRRYHPLVNFVSTQLPDNWFESKKYKISEYYKLKEITDLPIAPNEFGMIAKLVIDYMGKLIPDKRYPSTLLTIIIKCKTKQSCGTAYKKKECSIVDHMKAFEKVASNKIDMAKHIHNQSVLKLKKEQEDVDNALIAAQDFWDNPRGLVWYLTKNEIDIDELFKSDLSELSPRTLELIEVLKEVL